MAPCSVDFGPVHIRAWEPAETEAVDGGKVVVVCDVEGVVVYASSLELVEDLGVVCVACGEGVALVLKGRQRGAERVPRLPKLVFLLVELAGLEFQRG